MTFGSLVVLLAIVVVQAEGYDGVRHTLQDPNEDELLLQAAAVAVDFINGLTMSQYNYEYKLLFRSIEIAKINVFNYLRYEMVLRVAPSDCKRLSNNQSTCNPAPSEKEFGAFGLVKYNPENRTFGQVFAWAAGP
uniref:Cystatin domain-containing protein n=1 Tax=Trichuris muris TaxID=70415 RepID=A0A5S6QJM9_TRIMR